MKRVVFLIKEGYYTDSYPFESQGVHRETRKGREEHYEVILTEEANRIHMSGYPRKSEFATIQGIEVEVVRVRFDYDLQELYLYVDTLM